MLVGWLEGNLLRFFTNGKEFKPNKREMGNWHDNNNSREPFEKKKKKNFLAQRSSNIFSSQKRKRKQENSSWKIEEKQVSQGGKNRET